MAKKQTRKTPRSSTPVAEIEIQPSTGVVSSTGRSYTSDFNPDYSLYIKDLRRIGILASIFFGILIVLAIVLP